MITRKFNKQQLKNLDVRQHCDGRISVFFREDTILYTLFLKSDNLNREIECKRIGKPQEIAPDSMFEWQNWEEV